MQLRAMEEKARAFEGNEELLNKLRQEQERLAVDAQRKQKELEDKLKAQIEETEKVRKKKGKCNWRSKCTLNLQVHPCIAEKEMRERSLLDEKLLKTIPMVNEANAISEELGKGMSFEPKLVR
jgi:hypothetical protein